MLVTETINSKIEIRRTVGQPWIYKTGQSLFFYYNLQYLLRPFIANPILYDIYDKSF